MARAKKTSQPKKGKARGKKGAAEETELEVEAGAEQAAPKPGMTLESGLVIVTFLALLAAFILVQVEMRSAFGEGWPF